MIINDSLKVNKPPFSSTQRYLNWFAFFSVFPLINIAGISITFFIFLVIVYKFLEHKKKLFKITSYTDIFLLFFLFFVLIAGFLTEESYRDRSIFSIAKLMIQYVYWVVIALFIKTWIYEYDFYRLSRTFFFASAVAIIYYMTLNPFYTVFYPNEIAYALVVSVPLGFYYMMRRFSFWHLIMISGGYLFGMLMSGSRTGTALILLEIFFLLSLGSKRLKKASMIIGALVIPLLLVLLISIDKSDVRQLKYGLADAIDDYSPKIAHTLRMEENIMERDKSWLIRELMWQKTERIFDEHPFFGIGPGNFMYYYTDLDIKSVSHWLQHSERNYNRRSSQNSYILVLAEDGIFAFVSLLVVFMIITWKGFSYLFSNKNNVEIFIYLPFIALIIYGMILVTIQGSLFWLLLGFSLTLIQRKRQLS